MKDILKVIFIQLYQLFYWLLSYIIKHEKYDVVIIAKHNNNVINYLKLHPTESVGAITNNKNFRQFLEKYEKTQRIIAYQDYNPFSMIQQIVMILQTNKIVIDDYYAPLFIIDRTKDVWNIWHAYAVYKQIGLSSPIYRTRQQLTLQRYQRNYERIDKLFVRSEIEQRIFKKSYNLSGDQIIIDARFYRSQYADMSNKRTKVKQIVYAPTFREYPYNFIAVYEHLQRQFPEYQIVARFHQKTLHDYPKLKKLNSPLPLKTLLENAAIFMTDYSALLLEIADLNKPIDVYQVYDAADYVRYVQTRGLNEHMYKRTFPLVQIETR